MSWQGIEGHDAIVERFRRSIERGRLASTFLFVGPSGIGKRTFALKLAQSLLCQQPSDDPLAPCGRCDACQQVLAGTHPDLLLVAKPADKSAIPISLLIGEDQRRMQEGLCHDIALKPFMGGRRIAIVDDADDLNEEGANCLLKTLEEPPPKSLLILIGTSVDRQLPTIRSRSQIVRFQPLSAEIIARLLEQQGLAANPQEAARVATFADGSLQRAVELLDPELWAFRGQLLNQLAKPRLPSLELGRTATAFIDEAGKEAPRRRIRARQLIGFAAEFYRQIARSQSGLPAVGDEAMCSSVQRAETHWTGREDAAVDCAERCLEALGQVDRNANQATLVEAWANDLGRIAAH
jgi:DNA polymerase-3 subunit delta'